MAQLIVGHTTDTATRVWLRGDRSHRAGAIELTSSKHSHRRDVWLWPESDYITTVDFVDLQEDTEYVITATLGGRDRVKGRVRTMASAISGVPTSFSFVLSSCNLSVVSINNLVARLLVMMGAAVAWSSLSLPRERWIRPLVYLLRWVGYAALWLAGSIVIKGTAGKQPGPPYLRSPFLKLSAVFDSWVLTLDSGDSLPAVGDTVRTAGAQGIVACASVRTSAGTGSEMARETRRVVLTQVEGAFVPGQTLTSADGTTNVGTIVESGRGVPWYERPSFFIHAGDQIYYDFPTPDRAPDRHEYRVSYKEAWFIDEANRHLLSHWPQYMTWDDHEIADQFARDFHPPNATTDADSYFREAAGAYFEYVQSRHPPHEGEVPGAGTPAGPHWYRFNRGQTRFFVLDTRSRRVDGRSGKPQILDRGQLDALLAWMTEYTHDLKFVVSSVPFVAQVKEPGPPAAEAKKEPRPRAADVTKEPIRQPDWYADDRNPRHNPPVDTWCAERFRGQRDEIIDHIHKERIERLVFLTGDMHCCYHASMRIGAGLKYETTTVHELAGGPANQLQLPSLSEFDTRHQGRTDGDVPYEVVLDRFHSQVSAVMHVRVADVPRRPPSSPRTVLVPEVEWNVVRTLTDPGASAWRMDGPCQDEPGSSEETMSGSITFVTRRLRQDLCRWPEAPAQ